MYPGKAAQYMFLVFIYTFCICKTNGTSEEDTTFKCTYTNSSASLIIRNGHKKTQILECLSRYNSAEYLTITHSGLETIPDYLNILTKLVSLDLSYNNIKEAQFMSINRICGKLRIVTLNFNEIRRLRAGYLDCLESIENFHVANNSLTNIENGTFSVKLRMLKYVHLVNNELTVFDSSLCSTIVLSKEASMTINATRNKIRGFTNSIHIAVGNISRSNQLTIVLTHNNFTGFNTKYYFDMFNITNPLLLLNLWNSEFDLRFNPFKCDCSLYPLAMELRIFYHMDPDNFVFSITCGSPPSLKGKLVRLVPKNQFNCSVVRQCPVNCSCTETVALDVVTINCGKQYQNNELPERIPRKRQLRIDMKSDTITKLSSRNYLNNATVLDVSECSVSDIEPDIVNQLHRIGAVYLHNNQLQTIPRSFARYNFSEQQVLSLYGNPFNCDCHALWMKKWLLSNKTNVYNKNKIICGSGSGKGMSMIEVPDSRFVCQSKPLLTLNAYLAITFSSVTTVVLILTVMICNKTRIQIFMISNFDICKYCCRTRRRRSLVYDIFIPHSCEDDNYVKEIVNKLEKHKPPYKVCLGERNFAPGKTISENVLSAIEASHTTLLVVSNNFLKSSWCNMEFREAHMRFIRDQSLNMALVVLEDLDPKLIFKELKFYMDSHVYISYNDNLFWAKLLQTLPIMTPGDDVTETSPLIPN